MATDTGESSASINARSDANAWPRIYTALVAGAILFRPVRLTRYYTQCKDDRDPNHNIGISASFVKRQEKANLLIRAGIEVYALNQCHQPEIPEPVEQPSLFPS